MKKILFFSALSLFSSAIFAQIPGIVSFSGHVRTDLDSINLQLICSNSFLPAKSRFISIPVSKDGTFRVVLSDMSQYERISIQDAYSNDVLFAFGDQFAERGDNIHLEGLIHDKERPYYFKGQLSGKGSEKYSCIQSIKRINEDTLLRVKSTSVAIKIADSLIALELHILDSFKARLKPGVYALIKADITGRIKYDALFIGWINMIFPQRNDSFRRNEIARGIFHRYVDKNDGISSASIPFSVNYIRYLFLKEKLETLYSDTGMNIKKFYLRIKNKTTGHIRDKILDCFIVSDDVIQANADDDSEDYFFILRDAVSYIETPAIKLAFENLLKSREKGITAFNFNLPADSSEKNVALADYRGKVVLLDMWNYQCSGCYLFAKVFHEKVFPLFKSDSNFVVISIMLGESSRAAYLRRLRRQGGVIYVYPEYVNLFGGKGIEMGRKMEDYYGIESFPFLLLIGKEGRIFSSRVPFFTDDQSPNINDLIEIIRKALKAKS